ncbi:hypothetical protein D3C87_1938560 [compost metagenome]
MERQMIIGRGFLRTFRKSLKPRLMLPAKVRKANSQGDKYEYGDSSPPSRTPITMLVGVINGIMRFSR